MPEDYTLQGFHHVHWWVGNVLRSAYYYQKAWGFKIVGYRGLETGSREVVSMVLEQGKIKLVLSAPLVPDGPGNAFLSRHGEGVSDVAFLTDNAEAAFQDSVGRGAEAVHNPTTIEDEHGSVRLASIKAYNDVIHTFVDLGDYTGSFLPGYGQWPGPHIAESDSGLVAIDHIVHNMPGGGMQDQVQFYQDTLGFHRFWSVDDKDISTEYSSLRSIVVANENLTVKMPVNEPAEGLKKSQIQEFIDYNIDAGVQHMAMLTKDIVKTISTLKANGIDFLTVPDAYYAELPDRVGQIEENMETLRSLSILVDRDEDGYLLQLFTKPIQDRPTFFFEVIQRKGSQSFGKGNFKALFESMERDQARRGNL